MREMFIEREGKAIKLTAKEIEEAYTIQLESNKNQDEEFYRNKLKEFIVEEYSNTFAEYLIKEHNLYFEQLVECCYYNQDAIDNIGIGFIYDLEKECKEKLQNYYIEMGTKASIDIFIKELVENYEKINYSDLQGLVQARCIKTKENENNILNEIEKQVKGEKKMEFYIERKIIKRGKQKIKLTPEEIKEIANFYINNSGNEKVNKK